MLEQTTDINLNSLIAYKQSRDLEFEISTLQSSHGNDVKLTFVLLPLVNITLTGNMILLMHHQEYKKALFSTALITVFFAYNAVKLYFYKEQSMKIYEKQEELKSICNSQAYKNIEFYLK
ncbi:hypothetical protein HYV79_02225 [Candidatus Woesearchaeota archaeon]|nr:hypothetical protein [Candidatus Woesearchaeota archaeon]